ncbi:hypothetical protein ABI59_08565 [Acidobacteria bacterium Mor1]|nr:hypothetical protein ABI59_08565 [Acidobacteria bacterium Mor1]
MVLSPRSSIERLEDGVVLLEHEVVGGDDFARAANDVFALIREAEQQHPGALRRLMLTITGHDGERAGFDADFFEFQQEFMLLALGKYLTWVDMPLTGSLANPGTQQNDLPDKLKLEG